MNNTVKVGFCVAYDWSLLAFALPMIYSSADVICLSIDKDRISWGGNQFSIDETAFNALIKRVDVDNKIQIYQDNFHITTLTSMQNEVRQRNLMSDFMKPGGWHIQLDCDEYFLKFDSFVTYLKRLSIKSRTNTNICCVWITLFKELNHGYLCIQPQTNQQIEYIQIATQKPNYQFGRRNGDFNISTPYQIIHQSWARSEQEINQKLTNWGHKDDFDTDKYFLFWKNLNKDNYQNFQYFHPVEPGIWTRLEFIEATSTEEFVTNFERKNFPHSKFDLFLRNNRTLAKIKEGIRLLTGK